MGEQQAVRTCCGVSRTLRVDRDAARFKRTMHLPTSPGIFMVDCAIMPKYKTVLVAENRVRFFSFSVFKSAEFNSLCSLYTNPSDYAR